MSCPYADMKFGSHLAIQHQAVGVEASVDMGIAMNGKVFRILLDGLYSDKIGSIVRETISNAFDSHIRADKLDVPFLVRGPTTFEPSFRVRDFGVGMTHSEMFNVFANLGLSTKDGSNEEVGCYGLGAKCPLSYVDAFTVTCFDGEEKRVYSVAWAPSEDDDVGMPRIDLLDSMPSDEARGVEVLIPVKRQDYDTFNSNIAHMSRGLATVFQSNVTLPAKTVHLERNGVTIFDDTVFLYGAVIRQGCVTYPIDINKIAEWRGKPKSAKALREKLSVVKSAFPDYKAVPARDPEGEDAEPAPGPIQTHSDLPEEVVKLLANMKSLMLDVPIGTIDVTASREAIQYTERTVLGILDALQRAHDIFMEQVQEFVERSRDPWSAAAALRDLTEMHPHLRTLYEHKYILGRQWSDWLDFTIERERDWPGLEFFSCTSDYKSLRESRRLPRAECPIVVMDASKRPKDWLRRIKLLAQEHKTGTVRVISVTMSRKASHLLIHLLEQLGDFEPLLVDDLPSPPMTQVERTRLARDFTVWKAPGGNRTMYALSDFADEQIAYVPVGIDGMVDETGNPFDGWTAVEHVLKGQFKLVGVAPTKLKTFLNLRPDAVPALPLARERAKAFATDHAKLMSEAMEEAFIAIWQEQGYSPQSVFALGAAAKHLARQGYRTPFTDVPDARRVRQATNDLNRLCPLLPVEAILGRMKRLAMEKARRAVEAYPYVIPLSPSKQLHRYLIEQSQKCVLLPLGPDTYEIDDE